MFYPAEYGPPPLPTCRCAACRGLVPGVLMCQRERERLAAWRAGYELSMKTIRRSERVAGQTMLNAEVEWE